MGSAISPRALSRLIGSIYECALDPNRWEPTLTDIVETLNGRTSAIHLHDIPQQRLLIYKHTGMTPYWEQNVHKYQAEIDAVVAEILASPSPDKPYIMSRRATPAQYATSRYYNECLKPEGIVDAMQFVLMATPGRFSAWAINRHEQYGTYSDEEIESAELLLPHVRRAVTISNVLDARTIEGARIEEALDGLRCGVFLTNERGAILHANRAGETMLQSGFPIDAPQGILRAKTPAADKELRTAIRLAARDDGGIGNAGLAICLTGSRTSTAFAHILPMTGSDLGTWHRPEATAAVFVNTAPEESSAAQMMAQAFGLTTAETRVLASLLAGHTLSQTATTLGIAQTTAKTHLENIFAKTGVSRQADLMRLMAHVVPPTRSD